MPKPTMINLPDGCIARALKRTLAVEDRKPRAKRFEGKRSKQKELALALDVFLNRWKNLGGPELEAEHRFHPTRKWRLDYAHVASKVGIEIHGAVFAGGRHTSGVGFTRDREKMNAAVALGWRVIELTTTQAKDDATIRGVIELILTSTATLDALS